jgi:hypothetical protein
MAAAPPSFEQSQRRSIRFACGVTFALVFIQLVPWPLALLTPALVNLLLQDAKPMPPVKALRTIGAALAGVFSGFLLSLVLSPYPVILILTLGLVLYLIYFFVLTTGEHFIIVVGLLIGVTLIPVLLGFAPELAYIAAGGIMLSIVAAFLIAAVAFALIPPPEKVPQDHHHAATEFDVSGTAANLAVVVGSMLAAFLYLGLTDVLVLVYTALFAMSVSTAGSTQMSLQYLKGNVLYGGLGMIIVFEVLVMAPFLPLMIFLVFLAIYFFAGNIFSHKETAGAWSSGSYGFILLLSGALVSDKVVASAKVFDRVSQMAAAAIYVTFAFAVLEYLRARRVRNKVGAGNG